MSSFVTDSLINIHFGGNEAARHFLEVYGNPYVDVNPKLLFAGEDGNMLLRLNDQNGFFEKIWPEGITLSGVTRIVVPACDCITHSSSVTYHLGDNSILVCLGCNGLKAEYYMGTMVSPTSMSSHCFLYPKSRGDIVKFVKDWPELTVAKTGEDAFQDRYPHRCGCGARCYVGLKTIECTRGGCRGIPLPH